MSHAALQNKPPGAAAAAQATDRASDLRLVAAVVAKDPVASRELVQRFSPIIRRRVSCTLAIMESSLSHAVGRSDVLDLTQEMFVILLDRDARVLRAWDPERGLSLANFIGLVAERESRSVLRSGRRSGWAEAPTRHEDLVEGGRTSDLEAEVSSRQQLEQVMTRVRARLSSTGLAMFEALFLHQRPIDEVASEFSTTAQALYVFRNRVRRELQDLDPLVNAGHDEEKGSP
jgi:hypothetical protein